MFYTGLFVGLTTLDFIYLSDRPLQENQKLVAREYLTVAGGPATNAAVAFSYFENHPMLVSAIGQHPLTEAIEDDLSAYSVEIVDLTPNTTDIPPVSSVIVTATTGKRAVISLNAVKSQVESQIDENILSDIEIVLIDGHQIPVSLAIAKLARNRQIPVVLDGGSWKPGLEIILPYIDYAVCSANFYPPQCHDIEDVFAFLQNLNIAHIAITDGDRPIQSWDRGHRFTVAVPSVETVDTLGAGDIFHGAFCHYILEANFATALTNAAEIASKSCEFFGTRSWLDR